ncbi:29644_t:CDS:1, partial [Gigaspora margarita]
FEKCSRSVLKSMKKSSLKHTKKVSGAALSGAKDNAHGRSNREYNKKIIELAKREIK